MAVIQYVLVLFVGLLTAGVAGADQVKLANGDTINGEIVEWAVDYVVVEHPQLGRVRLELDQLALDTGKEPSRGLFDTSFLRGWTRRVELGWNGRNGDDNSINITASLRFAYDDPFKRWRLNGRYFFQDSDDDADNNARIDLVRDLLFPGNSWFLRGSLRYQFDAFESWENRLIFSTSPGYHLVDGEKHKIDTTLGPTATREFGSSNTTKFEALWGFDWEWQIMKDLKFSLQNQLFTELVPDALDFRNLSIGRLEIRLMEKPDLAFVIGIENEYESNPDPGDQANDLIYNLSLGIGF
jgi:putative salt-induced outer membrane protein YdiY